MNKQLFVIAALVTAIASSFIVQLPLRQELPLGPEISSNVDAIAIWSHDTEDLTDLYDIYYSIYNATADTWWSLQPSATAPIATLPGDDLQPAISFDHKGNAIAVWSHDTGDPTNFFDIYYSQWLGPALGWTTPTPVAGLSGDDLDPAVALWTDGTGTAVWVHDSGVNFELWYVQWNGSAWLLPAPLVAPWPVDLTILYKQPEIAYDANHNLIAVWTDGAGFIYNAVLYDGLTTWTPGVIPLQPWGAATSSRKGISSDRLGNAKVVWNAENFPLWDNQYALRGGIDFSSANTIYNDSIGHGTAVAFGSDNNAIAVHGTDLTLGEIWTNRELGGTWQPSELISSDGMEPRIAFLNNGRAIVVYSGFGPLSDSDILYAVWDPTLGWISSDGELETGGLLGDDGPLLGPVAIAASCGSPTSPPFIHDVAVTDVTPLKTIVGQGYNVSINGTVENQGDVAETFDVTAYYKATPTSGQWDTFWSMGDVNKDGYIDETDADLIEAAWGSTPGDPNWNPDADLNQDGEVNVFDLIICTSNYGLDIWTYFNLSGIIDTQTVTLTSGNSKTITLTWDTTGIAFDYYTISAVADTVPGEIDTADNTLVNGDVMVTIPGDVNGDRIVDIFDIGIISAHWYPGPPIGPLGYHPNADINCNGAVDIFDIGITSAHWNQSW